MIRYLIRRIVNSVLLLAGVSILSFVLVEVAPGDFFDEMRLNPRVSASTIAGLKAAHELNQPLPVRYLHWFRSVVRGEWGFSFAYNSPAAPILILRARNTLLLTGTAMFLAWIIALPLGAWTAVCRGRAAGLFASGAVSFMLAMPDLLLALLLLMFAVRTGLFPIGGMISVGFSDIGLWAKCKDVASHLFLPAICLASASVPMLTFHLESALSEVLDSSFIRAARAYGIPPGRLLVRHALPAAANPMISLFGLSIGTLLSSSLLIEAIFGWPGLGQLLLQAILQRDFYLVIGSAMLGTVFLVSGNLLADVLLYASDPRIRPD
jgi:peptide/nickel transport system permease protein